jgi:hypothetical protein
VRYETNDYSVPVEYGHRQVLLKAFVWEVVIWFMSEVIARHKRSYGREEMIFNPLHYLSLLEQKSNALDQAAPLAGWQLPEEFTELRRQMEGRMGKRGRRGVNPKMRQQVKGTNTLNGVRNGFVPSCLHPRSEDRCDARLGCRFYHR